MPSFTKVPEVLPQTLLAPQSELDQFIEAFEAALQGGDSVELTGFLPEPADPLYRDVLRELIRVDLEFSWRHGRRKLLEEYAAACPQAFLHRPTLLEIAFEECRLRRLAGERPDPAEYQRRLGIRLEDRLGENGLGDLEASEYQRSPEPAATGLAGQPEPERRSDPAATQMIGAAAALDLEKAALAYQQFRAGHGMAGIASGPVAPGGSSFDKEQHLAGSEAVSLFRDVHRADPQAADRLAQGLTRWPEVGSRFLAFRLLGELGRGAFARVYLAEQGDLANRPVALKVATDIAGESQTLAQLQHTNIVPIYSVHRADPYQAVCMPYLGSTTLADVLARVGREVTLPHSGKMLITTLNDRKASTARAGSSRRQSGQSAAPKTPVATTAEGESPRDATAALRALEGMSYVDAVLWMASRLADGLAHAHERGVLHRDLKPANVLLTEDGQPMLLDFNLSANSYAAMSTASIGGTLPYMAPEHLEAFAGEKRLVDARSDLYSLGVILYELLTGKYPFRPIPRLSRSVLAELIAERRLPPPGLRWWNPALSPAVESIVHHCLEPDPDRRYQNAKELQGDLERQLHHLPLKHAPEPSWWERTRKFVRRHPRLTSASTVAAMAGVVVTALAIGFIVRGERVARQEARDTLLTFEDRVRQAQTLLCARSPDRWELEEGTGLCRAALEQYGVLDNPDWQKTAAVDRLTAEDRARLLDEVGELLLLLADGSSRQAIDRVDRERRQEQLQLALHWNGLAESRALGNEGSPALWRQRADLAGLLGNKEESAHWQERAKESPLRTTRDLYLTAHEYFREGNPRAAIPLLQEATRRDPQNFPAWAVLANCHNELAQEDHALACYSACIALRPGFYPSWLNRGLVYLRQRFYELARADFAEVIALRPDMADAYINRALAREGLGDYRGAVADLDEALRRGTPRTRVYFMRAIAREHLGDREGARADREHGLRERPVDEKSWLARGEARATTDPRGALSDFEEALQVNPRSIDALQDRASVLAENLGRTEEAIRALDQAIALAPDFVPARAGRGILLARLGKRTAAEQDAREALLRDTKPPNLYQVAGIYALNSRQNPTDRLRAFELLSAALTSGFGLDLVDQDHDLDPIRQYPEFGHLVAAARRMHSRGSN
jgi:serine/threonine protein kinase/Tfp pilus assembly protein PilF